MDFLLPAIEKYASVNSEQESELLRALTRETHLRTVMPRMLSGHLQGRFLSLLSRLVQPKAVLEIGTFTGYSTLCIAEGLAENGSIDTLDSNEETTLIARKYADQSAYREQINFITGNALELIPGLNKKYDFVFIDADKENYSQYFDLVVPMTRKGGLIIADNVLWSGKVLDPEKNRDKDTVGLMNFTSRACNDQRVVPLLMPLRDGLMILHVK